MTTTRNPFFNEMRHDFNEIGSWPEAMDLLRHWKSVLLTLSFHRGFSWGVNLHEDDTPIYERAEQVLDSLSEERAMHVAVDLIDEVLTNLK